MVFSVDPEQQRIVATIPNQGRNEVYECILTACDNPVCECRIAHLELIPEKIENQEDLSLRSRRVDIDVIEKKLDLKDKTKIQKEDLDFAKQFVSCLDDDDFELLYAKYIDFKNILTNNAPVETIDAVFDFDQVENEGLMTAYNDILPFGDPLHIAMDDKTCIVFDHYCVKPKCSCTDAMLAIMALSPSGKKSIELCSMWVNYKKRNWKFHEGEEFPLSVKTLKSITEEQIPDIYERLRARHGRLKAIYAHCKARRSPAPQPSSVLKVGRNDPCPCGSGKKHKKCCLGKPA